jgi:hypothetical protein
MVYFDPSSGTSVVSSPVWNLTSFHEVRASSFVPARFCPPAKANSRLVVADAIATAANVNITRVILFLITTPVSCETS